MKVTQLLNYGNLAVDIEDAIGKENSVGKDEGDGDTSPNSDTKIIENQNYEFIGIDSGLEELLLASKRGSGDRDRFADFEASFQEQGDQSPFNSISIRHAWNKHPGCQIVLAKHNTNLGF